MSIAFELGDNLCDMPTHSSEGVLRIRSRTWNRDSHSLFDYEASQLNCHQFRVSGRCVDLYRSGNEVFSVSHGDSVPVGSEFLVSVFGDKGSGEYRIASTEMKRLWSVASENWCDGVKIQVGDLIKLGRFKLRVRQIVLADNLRDDNTSLHFSDGVFLSNSFPDLSQSSSSVLYAPALTTEQAQLDPSINQMQCRICLSEGPCVNDPLICPCECTGSIRYVHAQCIGHWLHGRLGLEQHAGGPAYFFRQLACELCHANYPVHYSTDGGNSLQCIAPLPKANPPFIVIENVAGSVPPVPAWTSDSTNTFPSGLHVVELASVVKIGRGHDCDVRVSDVSISRLHASLRLEDDGVYLRDEKSKFGTLIAVGPSICIPKSSSDDEIRFLSVQAGRSVLTFASIPSQSEESVDSTINDTQMMDDVFDSDGGPDLRPHTN